MFSPHTHVFSPPEWDAWLSVARCSAQVFAPAAILSLHTSAGTPTAARSRLWIPRMVLTKAVLLLVCVAVAFPILLLSCGAPAGGASGGGVSVAGGASGGGVSVAGGASAGGVAMGGGGSGGGVSPAEIASAAGGV